MLNAHKSGTWCLAVQNQHPAVPTTQKNTKNCVLVHTLINLKALKHVEFNKGSSIMHKTTQNQRCMFKQNHKVVETNQSSSYRLADLHCRQAVSGQNPKLEFKHHEGPPSGFWKNSRNTKNPKNLQNQKPTCISCII